MKPDRRPPPLCSPPLSFPFSSILSPPPLLIAPVLFPVRLLTFIVCLIVVLFLTFLHFVLTTVASVLFTYRSQLSMTPLLEGVLGLPEILLPYVEILLQAEISVHDLQA